MNRRSKRRSSGSRRRGGSSSSRVTQHPQAVPTSADENFLMICAICCDDTSEVSEVARPSVCEHVFCRECLQRFCRTCSSNGKRPFCPLDRKPFDRIAVRRREDSGLSVLSKEAILDAATLKPLPGIFESPTTPAILGCVLISALCSFPSWLLALHSLAVVGIFCATKGIADFGPYTAYMFVFYCALVPARFIGLLFTAYTWASCLLMIYCAHGVPALTSGNFTPEKLLHAVTSALVCLVCPMTLFSVYSVVQAACYGISLLTGIALCNVLSECHGAKFARTSLLFFNLVFAPYVCQLQHLSLPHLAYVCLLLLLCLFVAIREVQLSQEVVHLPANLALNFSISWMLSFSPWITLYSLTALAYASIAHSHWKVGKLRQVRLLLGINASVVGCLLPWQLFGLLSYLTCMMVMLTLCYSVGRLMEYLSSLPNGQVISAFYNSIVLGVVVPSVLIGQ